MDEEGALTGPMKRRPPIGMLLATAALVTVGAIGAVALVSPRAPAGSPEPSSTQPMPSPPEGAPVGWSAGPDMSIGRAFPLAARLNDGRVLIAGGGLPSHYRKSAELYDPATNAFSPAAPMTTIRYIASATVLQDGRVLVAGGSGKTAEVYDPATNSWSLTGRMRSVIVSPGATLFTVMP